jgi:N4-(beta-N-acetylglucosaminyl)-L-asparaginase
MKASVVSEESGFGPPQQPEEEDYFEALENRFRHHLRSQSYLRLSCWVLAICSIALVLFCIVAQSIYIGVVYRNSASYLADTTNWPIVVTLSDAPEASQAAWEVVTLSRTFAALDAVEAGCKRCSVLGSSLPCATVGGPGSDPTDQGQSTMDALIMWAPSMRAAGVGNLKRIAPAISVARKLLDLTQHTLLVGNDAADFASHVGLAQTSLYTAALNASYADWVAAGCIPNSWLNQTYSTCPVPANQQLQQQQQQQQQQHASTTTPLNERSLANVSPLLPTVSSIGQIAIDNKGNIACGASSNGKSFRIHGSVGATAIVGAAVYCDNDLGGALVTGDYDVIGRFLPAFRAVQNLHHGLGIDEAADDALADIAKFYPQASVSIVLLNKQGKFSAATIGSSAFVFMVQDGDSNGEQRPYQVYPK